MGGMGFPRKRGHGRQLRYRELVSHSVWLFRSSCLWGSEKGREGYNGPAKWSRGKRKEVRGERVILEEGAFM